MSVRGPMARVTRPVRPETRTTVTGRPAMSVRGPMARVTRPVRPGASTPSVSARESPVALTSWTTKRRSPSSSHTATSPRTRSRWAARRPASPSSVNVKSMPASLLADGAFQHELHALVARPMLGGVVGIEGF